MCVGFGIAISFAPPCLLHLIDVSASFNSAGSGNDCISPLTRQIVFLYMLNGEGW